MKRWVIAAFVALVPMVIAACGDSDVCGGYAGGNVAVVKPCDRTVIVGEGQSNLEPNDPELSD